MFLPFENALQRERERQRRQREGAQHTHGHPDPLARRRGLSLGATPFGSQQHDGHGDRIDPTGRSSPVGSRD